MKNTSFSGPIPILRVLKEFDFNQRQKFHFQLKFFLNHILFVN